MENKCSVLVNSCDKYEDAWYPFFFLLKKYWPNCPYKIYLNTETKSFSFDGLDIQCINLSEKDRNKKITWSLRLKKALKQIKSDYVIFLLEDFFLYDYVNQNEIDKTISYIESDKNISKFSFYSNKKSQYVVKCNFEGYDLRLNAGRWQLNCQAALWRRKHLMGYLNKYEDAWQFEEYGSNMAKLHNKKFYKAQKSIFHYYVSPEDGCGIYAGEWLKGNVEFFKREGIEGVDFSKLGLHENIRDKSFVFTPSKKTLKEKWLYLLHGGDGSSYTSIPDTFKLIFKNPKKFCKMMKNKINFVFNKNHKKTYMP